MPLVFSRKSVITSSSSEHKQESSEHSDASSEHNGVSSEHNETLGEDSLDERLASVSARIKAKRRQTPEAMRAAILELCSGRFLPLPTLAQLIGRKADTWRVHYIGPMVERGELLLTFPDKPTHPAQAYMTAMPVSDKP